MIPDPQDVHFVVDAWRGALWPRDPAEDHLADVLARYAEPHRAYHNIRHICAVLNMVTEYNHKSAKLVFAAILHDVIYDPRAPDNEEKSALYARDFLTRQNWPAAEIDRVAELIMATKHHEAPEDDTLASILLDADLAILADYEGSYDEYAAAIREEYSFVPDSDYRVGRIKVLQSFLDRPRIFRMPDNIEVYEKAARKNIAAEIRRLSET